MPGKSMTAAVLAIAALAILATAWPFLATAGTGPFEHLSVRGEPVVIHGYGPYRHMPANVAVQGLAQDLVTLALAVPILLAALFLARRGSRAGFIVLTGTIGYLFVQYLLYLAMATYNELFLLWVALVLLTSQVLVRLLLAAADVMRGIVWTAGTRRYVGAFLLVNGTLIALLWLGTILPPLLDGTLYPADLGHLTTMVVQGFDLALFIPPSLLAGYWFLRRRPAGDVLAPAYAVFLALQMTALLAKLVWMNAVGVSAGPALVVIPLLLIGALAAAWLSLRPATGRTATAARPV